MKNILKPIIFFGCLVSLLFYYGFTDKNTSQAKLIDVSKDEIKIAYFASGCFWCVEAVSGYAGGHTLSPTYQTIGTGKTGHAETVAVYYNPKKVSFTTLLTVFFGSHDPTTVNGQHPDYGTQYRSIAFYTSDVEKQAIMKIIANLNKEKYQGNIVTEVTRLKKFYKAEAYHQNFEKRNPNQEYVRAVSIPRLQKFKRKFPKLLKK